MNPIYPAAEIITIGDEILIGQTIDTNSAWIGARLSALGIPVTRIISISDNPDEICAALTDSMSRASLVLLTGGLGPTNDDRTKKTLAEFFHSSLVISQDVLTDIQKILHGRNIPPTSLNLDQALVPDKCRIIRNPNGTAPGMWFESNGTVIISLPGVPFEMIGMMEQSILRQLADHFITPPILHKTVMTTGIAESRLASLIKDWEDQLPDGFTLAYLPSPGIVKLRITGKGAETERVEATIEELIGRLKVLISSHIYGYNEVSLEEVTGRLLRDHGLTLCTAESCTGGTIASLITSVPGSSAYFHGSVIAYSNKIKESLLSIPSSTIEKHGAVSREVVERMAVNSRELMKTDYAIAVSGIAGPDGGTPEKPVGTVWVAVAGPKQTESHRFSMGENRGRNIYKASLAALNMLRIRILKDTTG